MDIYLPAVLEVIPLRSKNLRSGAGGVTLLVEPDGVDARQAGAALLDEESRPMCDLTYKRFAAGIS